MKTPHQMNALPYRPTKEQIRELVVWGIAHGLLSVRPDATAVKHPKLYTPPKRNDLLPDIRRLREIP